MGRGQGGIIRRRSVKHSMSTFSCITTLFISRSLAAVGRERNPDNIHSDKYGQHDGALDASAHDLVSDAAACAGGS